MLEYWLGHLVTRIVLSVAIILSLVPHEWMHANDGVFLVLFLPEFIARLLLAFRKESLTQPLPVHDRQGWRLPGRMETLLLAVDLVALLSFLPWAARNTRWLRLFRLTRTVMLLRYWAPLVRDMFAVLRRRERARQLTLMMMTVVIVAFAGTVFLNHATDEVGEDFDGDGNVGDEHDHKFGIRMWWALRQIEDPGNMLSSPHETATLIVSVFLTFFGLFLVSFLIGVGTDAVSEVMDLSRLRSTGLKKHTVLINLDNTTRQLLLEVMGEYQKLVPDGLSMLSPRLLREVRKNAKQQREFVVVGRDHEPPEFLREPEFARVIYRENSDDDDEAFLDRADVPVARRIVVLADVEQEEPDDDTVRTLITIVERQREAVEADSSARTTLIAEILDESNIGAANKAIARAQGRVDAHIIPTERLLAQFTFCVARRQGVAQLLLELLTSRGCELYAHDYRHADGTPGTPPALPTPSANALEALYWRGLSRPARSRVVPVGVLMAENGSDPQDEARCALNPTPDMALLEEEETLTGFIVLAPNQRATLEFADEVAAAPNLPSPPIPQAQISLPHLHPVPNNSLRRVLICGFRPATVNLVESIITAEPTAEVLILVEDEKAKREALDDFDGHSNLVRTGLLQGLRGTFQTKPNSDELECVPGDRGAEATGRVVIEIGDWTSSRRLMRLPRDFGTAPQLDLVVMVSSRRHGSDATTATALMKLEHLQDHQAQAGQGHDQVVVAELINADLAHRLTRRYEAMGRQNITVFSIHELRAFFMFQSVVVPNFNRLYSELLAPWGQSFVRLGAQGGSGVCTFSQLAAQLRMVGQIPIAVELIDEHGKRSLSIGQGDPASDLIDLSRLDSIWVIRPERGSVNKTARHQAVGGRPPASPSSASVAQ